MTIGDGIGFAAMWWAIVQLAHLFSSYHSRVTTDEVKQQLDRIEKYFNDIMGPV